MENLESLEREESFKKELDELILDKLEPKKTKKDILRIKKLLNRLIENCKEEASEEELLKEFLEEYRKELETTSNIEKTYALILQYRAYKELLNRYRRNKNGFDKIVLEARKRDRLDNKENIPIAKNLEECMIGAVRRLIRKKEISNEKMLVDAILNLKSKVAQVVKEKLISELQEEIAFLNEYGFLDEYIDDYNKKMTELGLERLSYLKRNPIPLEKYDRDGKLVKDDEDIGVVDSFDTDYLEKLTVDQLTRMVGFFKEKYMGARIYIAEAISTIGFLNLWDKMIKNDDSAIENLSEEDIKNGLKNFEALAAVFRCNNTNPITEKMAKQYKLFLDKNGINSKTTIQEEFEKIKPELKNIRIIATDTVFLQCLSIYQLYSKDSKVKNWGVLKADEKTEEKENSITVVIEDDEFRFPLIIDLPKNMLLKELDMEDESKLPVCKNPEKIHELKRTFKEMLYLPTNVFYKKTVGEYYKEKPDKIRAILAGKKVKELQEKDDGSR